MNVVHPYLLFGLVVGGIVALAVVLIALDTVFFPERHKEKDAADTDRSKQAITMRALRLTA